MKNENDEEQEKEFDNMIESIKDDIIVELEDEGYEHKDKQTVA